MPRTKYKLGDILQAIQNNKGSIRKAAKELNMHHISIHNRLKLQKLKIYNIFDEYVFKNDK